MADERTFVIVGAGLAGAKAAEGLREGGFDGRIVLIGAEDELPYERPPLSKGYLLGNDPRESAQVHPESWYPEHNVELRLGTRVTAIDPSGHTVTLADGSSERYDKLLLATGSVPRRLDVPGNDLKGVHYLRTLPDSDGLLEALRPGGRVVVIGAGWIGLETAAAAKSYGAEVAVVEMDSLPLRRVLGDEVARVFADLHREHGVDLHFDARLAEITSADGRATGVRLADGTVLPADAVIVGVGIRPDTELAEAAGLAVDNGVVTDERLRTSDPDVYAAGDLANWPHPVFGTRIRVEHWANAHDGGLAAAGAMLGKDEPYDKVPFFFTDQYDLGMEYGGYVVPGGYDEVVFRGSTDGAREFVAFWLKDGRVLAGMNVNVWDVQDDIQALIRSGRQVDRTALADPERSLGEL